MDTWEPTWPGRPPGPGSLGKRIAGLRAERGWTQQQLADRLGISRVAVSHLETDLNTPGERTVALLAGLFRLEPHELVADSSYPLAKRDRLPVVVARWTQVEHQLDLFRRDLDWLDRWARADGPVATHRSVLDDWDRTLTELAGRCLDPTEAADLAVARRHLADRRAAAGRSRPTT